MTLHASSAEILEFLAAFEENRNVANPSWSYRIIAEDRRKYIAIDEVDADDPGDGDAYPYRHRGGRFLIDRETGRVYSIKGYGQRGYPIGTIAELAAKYREASATYDPRARCHVETRYSRISSTKGTAQ